MTRSVVDLIRQENSAQIVQRFDHVPSDAELASFIDPRIGTIHQKVIETDEGFRVVPGTLPLWFARDARPAEPLLLQV
ncbi:MAG: hypothetical protein WD066_12760 [Planctomycetaceae bacterium]